MDVFERLENLKPRGMKFGTAVTRALLDRLGSPDEKLKIIHIAGTNGKGSAAEYMSAVLVDAGYKTGTYTSPEVYGYYDRYRINLNNFLNINKYLSAALDCAGDLEPTLFEVETAAAVAAFAGEGCDYAVLECGMGGRDDATNAILKKELALIMSVSLEHTAYLGHTTGAICKIKAGIIKDCPAVISPLQNEEGYAYLSHIRGAIVADKPQSIQISNGKTSFLYRGKKFCVNAAAEIQAYNAAAVIEGARILGVQDKFISGGLARVNLSGRVQIFLKKGRKYVLDGAHNPGAFMPLAQYLQSQRGDKTVIYGCLSDKDIDGCLAALSGCADRIIAVRPDSARAMDYDKIYSACRRHSGEAAGCENIAAALEAARGDVVAVCGSFTLLKEAQKWIEKE